MIKRREIGINGIYGNAREGDDEDIRVVFHRKVLGVCKGMGQTTE